MKKYIITGILILGILSSGIKLEAQEKYVKSKGKMEGIIYFYAEDIKYLETEIQKLVLECKE